MMANQLIIPPGDKGDEIIVQLIPELYKSMQSEHETEVRG